MLRSPQKEALLQPCLFFWREFQRKKKNYMNAENRNSQLPTPEHENSDPTSQTTSKFDPKRYRKSQAHKAEEAISSGRKKQTVIPVRKPSKKQFVHAHPSPDFRADGMPTITDENSGDVYLIDADLDLPADIENKIDTVNLVTAITADGSLFLWFYKNSTNSWSESARIAVREASESWVRVIPDKSSNGYLLESPLVEPPDPVWPPLSFQEILETAFGARFIDSLDHPLIKRLRGDFSV
jgi:hypothetical protein